ncbi:Ig-like domain-containing protein [Erythrobacter sp. JK5]|uniref:Ig-like domain-containing protein n=1 Tax=Erythrobacter sp. JK5 TaxID=2829500 RepID=UPI001BAA5C1A|nr:Ig-like domain-containing protein [Erythrobacter sp. JK5]QUL37988.1 cadherin-like domain-containing protein [Erythrobacter sp. JK5]
MDFHDRNDENANLAQDQDPFGDPGTGAVIQPDAQNVVTLPPGASLENLIVEGRDLVIVLEDGSRIVIPDGAVYVPQIVIDGVAVPPLNVAQLLTGNEPEPAAGATQSSGGNFADDEGAIQAAFDLGDLLPFTDFGFPEDREEEIIPFNDEEPEVLIRTENDPIGSQDAIASVDEAGLPARGGEGGEPAGTDEPSNSETTVGTIAFNAPDGLAAVTVNGQPVTTVGQTITTPVGTLTITSINLATGEIGYSYTLDDNTLGEGATDVFEVVVEDADGDQATATLTINIGDDAPIAADDVGVVEAGSHAPITGDVLINDVPGADGYATDGAVLEFGNESGTVEPGSSLQGEYGVLTLNPDGTYTYVRDGNTPGGVEDTFTYTIVDQDGSTSSATLVIEIGDAPNAITSVPQAGEGTVVEEGGLPTRGNEPAGTGEIADNDADNNSDPSETSGSTITFNSPDGLASVTINGVAINPAELPHTLIQDGNGTLVITGFTYDPVTGDGTIEYEFTLGDNTSGDDTSFDFEIVITDLDGDTATDTLTITVVDDQPVAVDDFATQATENAPVTVDVFANDTPGADDVALDAIAFVEGSLNGQGTVVYNGDGTFTYIPAPGEEGTGGGEGGEGGEVGPITFDYTITDGDGDVSTATVTIKLLPDSEPEIFAEGDTGVDEAGLPARPGEPAGSDEASDSETATGVIGISTGNDTIGSLVINGVDVTTGGTVTTPRACLSLPRPMAAIPTPTR